MKKCFSAVAAALWLALAPAVHAEEVTVSVPKAELEQLVAAYALVKGQYVDAVDDKKLFTDAISGMLAELDPHSQYLNKQDLEELEKGDAGEYVGIGVEVEIDHGQIKVTALTEGGPAERAGIVPGDSIVSIDHVAVSGLRMDDFARRIRGLTGSLVKVSVLGQGTQGLRVVSLARAAIHNQTVTTHMAAPGIAWIRISEFDAPTAADLIGALRGLDATGGPKGLILDMRNDPGGLITAAVGVAAAFLPPDTALFSARGRMAGTNTTVSANERYYRTTGKPDVLAQLPGWARSVPLVVLVNGASASAAELVAGALQDHGRAKVVGSQTFGKGSIQMVLPLSADTAIKMTVARYFTPKGREIQAQGIRPDIVVPPAHASEAGKELQMSEADLPHHLPAVALSEPEPGTAGGADTRTYAPAEKTEMFGTSDDKALLAAVAALARQDTSGTRSR
jgi:carboxyl-terminal processing protease